MPRILLDDAINMEQQADNDWQQSITLYRPLEVEQILLPDSANCLAVQTFLKMCGLNFKVEPRKNAEYMSPSGKVPFIQCGETLIAEFDNIVEFINRKGFCISEYFSSEDKIDMRAYISLVNNVFGNAEQYICWVDPETLNTVTKPRHGNVYPWPLNHVLNWQKRQQITKKLSVLGWYNKTLDEIFYDVKQCCDALSKRLGEADYFFGNNTPCELDALVFGHVFTIITTSLPNKLAEIVKSYDTLVNLCKRIENTYFKPVDA